MMIQSSFSFSFWDQSFLCINTFPTNKARTSETMTIMTCVFYTSSKNKVQKRVKRFKPFKSSNSWSLWNFLITLIPIRRGGWNFELLNSLNSVTLRLNFPLKVVKNGIKKAARLVTGRSQLVKWAYLFFIVLQLEWSCKVNQDRCCNTQGRICSDHNPNQ